MILENNYSHASDVWSLGILAWELYSAFATGQERSGYSLPYCDLTIDQVGTLRRPNAVSNQEEDIDQEQSLLWLKNRFSGELFSFGG